MLPIERRCATVPCHLSWSSPCRHRLQIRIRVLSPPSPSRMLTLFFYNVRPQAAVAAIGVVAKFNDGELDDDEFTDVITSPELVLRRRLAPRRPCGQHANVSRLRLMCLFVMLSLLGHGAHGLRILRRVGTETTVAVKTRAWSFEDHRRLQGSISSGSGSGSGSGSSSGSSGCVFPFTYNSQARVTCVFNDSNLDDDDSNDVKGTLLGQPFRSLTVLGGDRRMCPKLTLNIRARPQCADVLWCGTSKDYDTDKTWTTCNVTSVQRHITCKAQGCKPACLTNCLGLRLN